MYWLILVNTTIKCARVNASSVIGDGDESAAEDLDGFLW